MKVAIILKTPLLEDVVREEYVIYADAAYKFAQNITDKKVLGVVGDFDSLGYCPQDVKVVRLNKEKDFTDGERAIVYAKECGATEVVIYGALGGRIEHILGNIALLGVAEKVGIKASIVSGGSTAELVGAGEHIINVRKGDKVSFIPYGGDCKFLSSSGLYYPLNGVTLTGADTRGISNEALGDKVTFAITTGKSIVIYGK